MKWDPVGQVGHGISTALTYVFCLFQDFMYFENNTKKDKDKIKVGD